jgi:hypothetical protein
MSYIEDPFQPVRLPNSQQIKYRDITDEEYKIAIVLGDALKQLTNRFNTNVTVDNIDGERIITFGNKLNSFQLKVQNSFENFEASTTGEALLSYLKFVYRPYESTFYVNLAYDIINERIESGMSEDEQSRYAQLTPENISDFAHWLSDSDSFSDSMWHSAASELEYFIQCREENEDNDRG